MFKKISHNRLKNSQNIAKMLCGTPKNQMFFSVSLPLFKNNFWKVTYSTVSTVCVTCVWVGVDNAWEQEKPEARKMLENRADSHPSTARFVGRVCATKLCNSN
jgi:hypothetical protein